MPTVLQRRDVGAFRPDWGGSVTLNQVDPASGVQSITLGLSGVLDSGVSIESLEGAASTFTSTTAAVVTLERPDGTGLLTAMPTTTVSGRLAAFDGVVDYAGASGRVVTAVGTDSASVTYVAGGTSSGDAALLVGTGTVTLPVVATARVAASVSGNFVAYFDSQVAATVTTVASTTGSGGGSGGGGGDVTTGTSNPGSALQEFSVTSAVQHVSFAAQTTGWRAGLGVAGFDARVGILEAVNVGVQVSSVASLSGENLDPVAAALHVVQTTAVNLVSQGAVLATSGTSTNTNEALGGFDQTLDYAGSSGFVVRGVAASGGGSATIGSAAGLAAFTGAAAGGITVQATGTTSIDGPGALSIGGALQAGAGVDVSYTFIANDGNLVDRSYYLAQNPDVAAAGVDPYLHYALYGWKEGRNPDALFDTSYYLKQNPDVAAAGVDPLQHFIEYGASEGRQPSLLFDDGKYLAANPSVAANGENPLEYYEQQVQPFGYGALPLLQGGSLGASPGAASVDMSRMTFLTGGTAPADPLVEAGYYDAQLGATLLPGAAAAAAQAAFSYDATGWQRGLNPDALFDTNYYLSHNPDVAAAHVDPLLHFEMYGWKEGRDPSASFSTTKYLAANPDVAKAGVDPLLQYVGYGKAEGRAIYSA